MTQTTQTELTYLEVLLDHPELPMCDSWFHIGKNKPADWWSHALCCGRPKVAICDQCKRRNHSAPLFECLICHKVGPSREMRRFDRI